MKKTNPQQFDNGFLRAGAATIDITPPLEVGLLMSSVEERWGPFESVRLPLKARAIALEFNRERITLVSLDLLALNSKAVRGWKRFKSVLAKGTSISATRIVLTCTHTHNAPESVAISDLYQSKPFRKWLRELEEKLIEVINEASAQLQPCEVSLTASELRGFSLQRRIPTPNGIIMSDSVQPIAPALLRRGPMDHRVYGIVLRNCNRSIATIVNAACHPVHEMCLPQISSDFPGELCRALENSAEYGIPLFFNGAAGDINPTTVSGGAECAHRHGNALAAAIMKAKPRTRVIKQTSIKFISRSVPLPTRTLKGAPTRRKCIAHLSAFRMGSVAIAFVPGEIFVETAQAIERSSPFERTIIVGFAEDSIGYVPTKSAFREGGYEIGPGKWSFLQSGAEAILRDATIDLLRELHS